MKNDPFPVFFAAKLIAETGLRGVRYPAVPSSRQTHAFIVNTLGAGSEDVKNLITLAKFEVHKKFGVTLEEEVELV